MKTKLRRMVIQLRAEEYHGGAWFDMMMLHWEDLQEIENFSDFEDLKIEIKKQILSFNQNKGGNIYVANNGSDFIKVGMTSDVSKRLHSLIDILTALKDGDFRNHFRIFLLHRPTAKFLHLVLHDLHRLAPLVQRLKCF